MNRTINKGIKAGLIALLLALLLACSALAAAPVSPPESRFVWEPGENGMPKLITYLDSVFVSATSDMIQLRYTWFVSDNVTPIKEGDRLGVFNVTDVEADRMVLKNREPIELKSGSSVNLLGNLSFYVENSGELRFYPTSMGGTQVMPEGVPVNEVPDIPDVTIAAAVAGRTEKTSGFEAFLAIIILLAVYSATRKRR